MTRILAAFALALLAATTSCRQAKSANVIALLTPLTTSDMWKGIHAGVFRGCEEHGCVRYWNAPTHDHDFARQIDLMEQERARGVQGIILAPTDASALIPSVAAAERSGIRLVIAETALATPTFSDIATITGDNTATGKLGAEEIGKHLSHGGTVAIVGLDVSRTTTSLRAQSFLANLRAHFPQVKVLPRYLLNVTSNSSNDLDPDSASAMLSHADAIFSLSAQGTRAVLETFRSEHTGSLPFLVACDEDADLLAEVRNDRIQVLIVQNAFEIGRLAVAEVTRPHEHDSGPHLVVVEPRVINRANIDSADVQVFLKPYRGFDR